MPNQQGQVGEVNTPLEMASLEVEPTLRSLWSSDLNDDLAAEIIWLTIRANDSIKHKYYCKTKTNYQRTH